MTSLKNLIDPKLRDLVKLKHCEMQLAYKQTKFHDREMLSSCPLSGRQVRKGSMLD
jgi:hypothetical protein|tara:strand:+ start:281 stop:448 length:168 start_codon:yes stop_codon:yes gene_type:complete